MSKVLIVVDCQNDFIDPSVLGVEHDPDKEIGDTVFDIVEHIKFRRECGYTIVTTRDWHDPMDPDNSREAEMPEHCLVDSEGAMFIPAIKDVIEPDDDYAIYKDDFTTFDLANVLWEIDEFEPISEIELVGFCTDICVIGCALMASVAIPIANIFVPRNLTLGSTYANKTAALMVLNAMNIDTCDCGCGTCAERYTCNEESFGEEDPIIFGVDLADKSTSGLLEDDD